MGLFGQSVTEIAVYRQLDTLRDRLWGSQFDDVDGLKTKEKRIDELAAALGKTEDRKVRKAQSKWIHDARQSIVNRRIEMVQEGAISKVRLDPLPVNFSP